MEPHGFLLALLIMLFHLQKAEAISRAMAVTGDSCKRKCGKIKIPYPFGMNKESCYLDETFEVKCNESTGSASLRKFGDDEVMIIDSICTSTHSLRIKNFPAGKLSFGKSGIVNLTFFGTEESFTDHYVSIYDTGSRYSISNTTNKFVVMGCDFYAYLVDRDTKEFLGGCSPFCNLTDEIHSSPCSGIHCCEINLPKLVRNVGFGFETMNTKSKSWESQCGLFAFMDKDFLSRGGIKRPQCNENNSFPVTYEWAVGNTNCSKAKGRKDYVCGQNTDCFNNNVGMGYRCKCRNGYKGNPYLHEGCQDVDECANATYNCSREERCVNREGGYDCLPVRNHLFPLLISLGTGLTICLLILIGFWGWRKIKKIKERQMTQKFFKRNGGLLLQQQMSSCATRLLLELKLFKIEELEKATDKFNESRILGKGGLGTVYKGMLSDGRIVAVKKANIIDVSQVAQFINEVFILSQINHRNIVKLFGCCLETEVPLLVYEYVSNGTLSNHLHDESNISVISWENRLHIAAEIAGALAYLHSCATTAIFHRDIKSSNILLDENYKAVISDFGLSRSVSTDKTHLTTLVGGTFGYLDPEYFRSGQLNDKSDVYAFGVVLAEILTGQKAISSTKDNIGLALRFRSAVKEQRVFEILEEVVAREGKEEEILAVAELTKRCLKINARKRPSMKEVAAELDQLRKTREIPGHEESLRDPLSEDSCSCSIHSEVEKDHIMSTCKN